MGEGDAAEDFLAQRLQIVGGRGQLLGHELQRDGAANDLIVAKPDDAHAAAAELAIAAITAKKRGGAGEHFGGGFLAEIPAGGGQLLGRGVDHDLGAGVSVRRSRGGADGKDDGLGRGIADGPGRSRSPGRRRGRLAGAVH